MMKNSIQQLTLKPNSTRGHPNHEPGYTIQTHVHSIQTIPTKGTEQTIVIYQHDVLQQVVYHAQPKLTTTITIDVDDRQMKYHPLHPMMRMIIRVEVDDVVQIILITPHNHMNNQDTHLVLLLVS